MKNEIIIYQSDDFSTRLEVLIEDDTIWLTQAQIVNLFDSSKANINEHVKNIFQSGELEMQLTVRKIRIVQIEGKRTISREILHYNLDMIISIGYRVNSKRGTQFRIWANNVLKEYLLKGYAFNKRINRIENDVHFLKEKANKFDLQIKTSLPPNEGIFFNGQVFDAYIFVSDLIKSAKESIILIDNYIDETVFSMLSKRKSGVQATIFTSKLSNQIKLDLNKHNQQYPKIDIKKFTKSHDRFLIIDKTNIFHIGASLKDLRKKWFAFSKINFDIEELIKKLNADM